MQNTDRFKRSVERFVAEIGEEWTPGEEVFPEHLSNELSLRPAWAVDCIQYLGECDWEVGEERTQILFSLISESLEFVRYSLDRKDEAGFRLKEEVQAVVLQVVDGLKPAFRATLNQVIYESKLSIEMMSEDSFDREWAEATPEIDIVPKFPVMLEQLREKSSFKNAFELYELLLPHFQPLPVAAQLTLLVELANTKRACFHEVAVLMLLHPKPAVRKKVAKVLYQFCEPSVFTSVDLRRLITIRNWVPSEEREGIDRLIAHLRKNKLSPKTCLPTKITRIVGSIMDGAGAASILMESKKKNQRQIVGFIIKVGVGIRTPFVSLKAHKQQADEMLKIEGNHMGVVKPISVAYVNKMVQHFLSESLKSGEVPEPIFLQIAEMFGAKDWQPQPLSWSDEICRLRAKYEDLSEASIAESLARSEDWHGEEAFAGHWFETGDIVDEVMEMAEETDSEIAECLMARCLDKWKTVFLINCLWMRSKKAHPLNQDLFVILHCLDQNMPPSKIPLICNLASSSVGSKMRQKIEVFRPEVFNPF